MDLLKLMAALYKSEINSGLQYFYDGGVTLWLGGYSPSHAEESVDFAVGEEDQAARWLDTKARRLFPESRYAKEAPKFSDPEPSPMLEAAKPLMKYLAENHNVRTKAIVLINEVELLEGGPYEHTSEFLKD